MSFNYVNNLTLGGLMGATPYSNIPILDGFSLQNHPQLRQQQQNLLQQLQAQQINYRTNRNTPSATSAFHSPLKIQQEGLPTPPVIKFRLPDNVIQDVLCRFIMNIPEEEKFDPVRALFQVELAHWFFIDHYCTDESASPALASLGHIPFNQFAYIMFKEAPHLQQYYANVDKYLADFRSYRCKVPTYGAILMNKELTQVLLVQGFRNQWGFPKGKVNENEDPVECAIREVQEETGYDSRPLIKPKNFIESKTQDRNDRLYLIRGVDSSFPFYPQTQYEIKQISWFNIDEIPEHKKDSNPKIFGHGHPASNFFTIYPYIRRLKMWIADKLEGHNKIACFRSKYFNPNRDEDESYHEESFAIHSQGTVTPTGGTSSVNKKETGEELIRSILGGMHISSAANSKTKPAQDLGSATRKGNKSKKRLFSEHETEGLEGKTAQDAAYLLSSAMGIPVNINMNSQNPLASSTDNSGKVRPKTKTPLSKSASQMRNAIKYESVENFNVKAKCWNNFTLDKQKLLNALQIQPNI